jgi:hypothetical protein
LAGSESTHGILNWFPAPDAAIGRYVSLMPPQAEPLRELSSPACALGDPSSFADKPLPRWEWALRGGLASLDALLIVDRGEVLSAASTPRPLPLPRDTVPGRSGADTVTVPPRMAGRVAGVRDSGREGE